MGLAVFMAVFSSLAAQNKGSFETNVTFQGTPRQLAVYVPANYDSSQKYSLMICLHGLGDNAVNFRNALTTAGPNGYNVYMPTTIFVCPEAANVNADYFDGAGGEQIIQSGIDYAKQYYNIDDSEILLQGFSLGGRAALRYGLDNPTKFKGLLLNTPAVQGVKEASNKSVYTFNYSNANKIPIYITHGGTDILYGPPIDSAYRNLVLNNGVVKLKRFPSMGHTIPAFPNVDSLKFFDEPAAIDYDADLVEVMLPTRLCGNKTDGAILVRNTGKQPITDISFDLSTGGTPTPFDWNGTINAYQQAIVPLPFIGLVPGYTTTTVTIKSLNTSIPDTIHANNKDSAVVMAVAAGKTLPYFEGFDGVDFPPQEWDLKPSGDVHTSWETYDDVKLTGSGSVGAVNTILIFDNIGRKEDLLSPVLDLTSLPNPHLTFDLAYNYHRFTPPYFTQDRDFADTLEILVSTNCGNSFTSVFKKGGADLSTFPTPIMNPVVIQGIFIAPATNNWQKALIPLSGFSTATQAVVCFRYISALGGSINIDNVSFGNNAVGVKEAESPTVKIYPNPASGQVFINAAGGIKTVEITDLNGKMLLSVLPGLNNGNNYTLDVSGLSTGIYLVKTSTAEGTSINKLVISR